MQAQTLLSTGLLSASLQLLRLFLLFRWACLLLLAFQDFAVFSELCVDSNRAFSGKFSMSVAHWNFPVQLPAFASLSLEFMQRIGLVQLGSSMCL